MWREAAGASSQGQRGMKNWWVQGGSGVLCWGSLCSGCLFSEATTPRPLTRVCSPLGRKMVTAARVAAKSASIWEVQQLGTTVLRAEPWQQDDARVFTLLLPLTHHASGSFPAHLGPQHIGAAASLCSAEIGIPSCPSGRSLWQKTLLS